MAEKNPTGIILYAEDDDDDFLLTEEAFEESRVRNTLRRVRDGEELMDYLFHRGAYQNPEDSPRPILILLDLNMPRKDGREALQEIKADPRLSSIPVVVLTTSKAEEDIVSTYTYGANSYIRKPVEFEGLVEAVKALKAYWFEVVELPRP